MHDLYVYVFAIDPGLTTGVTLIGPDNVPLLTREVTHEQFGFLAELLIPTYRPDVVIEDFIITGATASKSQAPWSLRQIGTAEYLAAKYDVPFHIQPPSAAKTFASNDKLKAIGWYVKGQDHGRDAQRHALLYLVRQGWWDDRLRLIA